MPKFFNGKCNITTKIKLKEFFLYFTPFVLLCTCLCAIINSRSPILENPAVLPIAFALPSDRFIGSTISTDATITRDFARYIPGQKSGYSYKTEQDYYKGYAEARYGITFRKAGWDCLRHYEIIAAGSVPYFIGIDDIPPNTMHTFPKSITRQLMYLPGVPSQKQVQQHIDQHNSTDGLYIDMNLFDLQQYQRLKEQLWNYSITHLTWKAMGEDFLSRLRSLYPCFPHQPNILFVSANHGVDYQSEFLFGALYTILGPDHLSSLLGLKRGVFKHKREGDLKVMYGEGFSYSDVFDLPDEVQRQQRLLHGLKTGTFDAIVITNFGNDCKPDIFHQLYRNLAEIMPLPSSSFDSLLTFYQLLYNPLVVLVDGSDTHDTYGCHQVAKPEGLSYHVQFIREYDDAFIEANEMEAARRWWQKTPTNNLNPICWTKCPGHCLWLRKNLSKI